MLRLVGAWLILLSASLLAVSGYSAGTVLCVFLGIALFDMVMYSYFRWVVTRALYDRGFHDGPPQLAVLTGPDNVTHWVSWPGEPNASTVHEYWQVAIRDLNMGHRILWYGVRYGTRMLDPVWLFFPKEVGGRNAFYD